MFDVFFTKYLGHYWSNERLMMRYTSQSQDDTKITSRVDDGLVPIAYIVQVYNRGLSFETPCADSIRRDLKKVHATYTLPLGRLTFESITWYKLPNSNIWQSLE